MFSKKKKEVPPEEVVRPEDIELYDLWKQQEVMYTQQLKLFKKVSSAESNLTCIMVIMVLSAIGGGIIAFLVLFGLL